MADQEKVTLEDVERDGDVLRLTDGRRLVVNPDEAAVASIWAHLAPLTLLIEDKDTDAEYNLTVTNEETSDTIAAKLADPS